MHEVRVTAPEELAPQIAETALKSGIKQISSYAVYVHGAEKTRRVLSAEVSTPSAKKFLDALLGAPWFDRRECSVTSREVRAIVSSEPVDSITRPRTEPVIDVLQDLWQLTHVTISYVGRAVGAGILLAYGMLHNNTVAIMVAALFVPFLSQVLAVSFGLWFRDFRLAKTGCFAVLLSIAVSIGAGALVGWLDGGPMRYSDFESPLVSLAISAVIGATAGLAVADDAGRRYMIGVAAAVQYAVYPIWFGMSLVLGLPPGSVIWERVASFGVNVATIAGVAAIFYASTGLGKERSGSI